MNNELYTQKNFVQNSDDVNKIMFLSNENTKTDGERTIEKKKHRKLFCKNITSLAKKKHENRLQKKMQRYEKEKQNVNFQTLNKNYI